MKPSVIRVVDLGLSPSFAASVSFAQALIGSIDTEVERPSADVEFVRCRDWDAIVAALVAPTRILHILVHGHASPEAPGFQSEDEEDFALADLAAAFVERGYGIDADLVFADCCDSGQQRFIRAVRDCIQRDAVYVGARRGINWHESIVFGSNLYGGFLRNMGRGVPPLDRAYAAAERARGADEQVVGQMPVQGGAHPTEPERFVERSARDEERRLSTGAGAAGWPFAER